MRDKRLKQILLVLGILGLGISYKLMERLEPAHGLVAQYYPNLSWEGPPALIRTDPEISTAVLRERREELATNRFSVEWEGYLEVGRSGQYQFALESDDGSWLEVDGRRVVDNGGVHGAKEVMGQVSLEEGFRRIRIRYFQSGGTFRIKVRWGKAERELAPLSREKVLPTMADVETHRRYQKVRTSLLILDLTLGAGLGWKLLTEFWRILLRSLSRLRMRWAVLTSRVMEVLKKHFSRTTLWVGAGFILVILLFFYDILFLGYTLLAAGPSLKAYHVIDPAASSLHHEPLVRFASKTYKQGLIPLWNPHSAIGTPLQADMQSAVFFPLNVLLFLNPSTQMWDFFMISRILIAGILAYGFFRRFLELKELAAFVGATAFMFSGHLILNLNIVYINAAILLPGLLYASERLLRAPGVQNLSLTGILIGLTMLGGHPESAFFALFYTSGYYLFGSLTCFQKAGYGKQAALRLSAATRCLLGRLSLFAGAALIGFLLSSILLIPFLEFVKMGWVGAHDTFFKIGLVTLSPSRLFELGVPYFWGPVHDTWDGSTWLFSPGYIGLVVALLTVALFLQGLAFQGRSLFFTGMVLFFLIKGYGLSTTFNDFIGNLPIFRVSYFTRYFPAEFMFSTAALAGIFIQRLLEGRVRMRWLGCSILLGLASIGLLIWLNYARWLEHNKLDYAIRQALPLPVILCLVAGTGTWLRIKKILSSTALAWVLGILLISELFFWMPKDHYKRFDLYAHPPPFIKFIQRDSEVFRVYGLDGFLYPNTASGYGLSDIGFLNAVVNRRYIDFTVKLIRPYVGFFEGLNVPNVENPFFSLLNLKYVVTSPWTPAPAPFFTQVYQQEARVYRNERFFPRAFIVHRAEILSDPEAVIRRLKEESFDPRTQIVLEEEVGDPALLRPESMEGLVGSGGPRMGGSTAEVINYTPTRVVVRTHMEHAGFLVLSDAYFPGWKALVDGSERKIYLTDYLIRSVFLDPGNHTVEFVYRPLSYKLGAWLMLLGCEIVAAAWVYSGLTRNKT